MCVNSKDLSEYIYFPNFFKLELIDCHIMDNFFKNKKIIEGKLSLDYLRYFYNDNNLEGLVLIDELRLRGFQFIEDFNNNFLKNISNSNPEEIKVIFTKDNNNKYKKINRKILFEKTINHDVNSDYYYNLIPLYVFGNKTELAEKEFIRSGYEILTLKELKTRVKISSDEISNEKLKSQNELKVTRLKKNESLTENNWLKNYYEIDSSNIFLEIMLKSVFLKNYFKKEAKRDVKIYRYLKSRNILTLHDIINFDIKLIANVNGVGKVYIKNLEKEIAKTIKKTDETSKEIINYKLPSKFLEMSLSETLLYLFDYELNFNHDHKLSYLAKKDIYDLDFEVASFYIKIKYHVYQYYDLNLIINKSRLTNISQRDKSIIYDRLYGDFTLQQLGDNYGLTRERVRQIVSKNTKKTVETLISNNFLEALKFNFRVPYFELSTLQEILDQDNLYIIGLIKNDAVNKLLYEPSIQRVYFDNEKFNNHDNFIKEIINRLPTIGLIDEFLIENKSMFEDKYGMLNDFEYHKILEKYGISIYRDYFSMGKPYLINFLTFIFKYKIKYPFRINDENILILESLYSEIFGEQIDKRSLRSWEGIIVRIEDMYLVGPRTYLHKKHQSISMATKQTLDNILKKEFKNNDVVSAKVILNLLNKEIGNTGFIEERHIYSYIKDVYSDIIDTSRGNVLSIYSKGVKQPSKIEILYDKCKENNGVITLEEAKKQLKWNTLTLENIIINSARLVKLSNDRVIIFDDAINAKNKEKLKKVIQASMESGYSSVKKIYNKAIFDPDINELFNKYNLTKPEQIVSVIKTLDENIAGHTVFLYYKDQNIQSIEDYILTLAQPTIYREVVTETCLEFGFASNQDSLSITKLINDEMLVRISNNLFIKHDKLKICPIIEKKLIKIIESENPNKRFVVPNIYVDKIKHIRLDDHIWNQYLIQYLLQKNGYKTLNRYGTSYQTEILVMVKKDKDYESVDQLVHDLLKSDYNGIFHEEDIYDYLSSLGIYNSTTQPSSKKFKHDLFENNLIKVDLVKRVTLADNN